MAEGIEKRHGSTCATRVGAACTCTAGYRATAFDGHGKRVRRTFPTLAAAKSWRRDMQRALEQGTARAVQAPTLNEATADWLAGAEAGTIRTRGRKPFAPSTLVAIEQNYRLRLREPFGALRLNELTTQDLQDFIDELDAAGLNPSTIQGTVLPLRVVYRRAKTRGVVALDPTDGIELPQVARGQRKPPDPATAAALLAAVPGTDRPLWATAMLAGLRRGELLGLQWDDVDLKAGTLRVERSYSVSEGTLRPTKSEHGRRTVPVVRQLAAHLSAHALATGRRSGFVFGDGTSPASGFRGVQERADAAWKAAGVPRVTLHACRHLYASMSIAAGVNAHALCKYMGHSGIQVTLDLYGHQFPGNEAEAAALQDAYLERHFVAATTA
jgi:integrase